MGTRWGRAANIQRKRDGWGEGGRHGTVSWKEKEWIRLAPWRDQKIPEMDIPRKTGHSLDHMHACSAVIRQDDIKNLHHSHVADI